MTNEVVLQLEGNANDLLNVCAAGSDLSMKSTRLIRLNPTMTKINEEIVDICVTSTNGVDEHPIFDKLLGKRIRMTVEVIG